MSIVYLSNVRLSFPHLIEPQKTINSEGKERISYNVDLIMPPNDPGLAAFMARYSELAVEKWKQNAQAVMQLIQNERKQRCYGAGEEVVNKKTFQPYDGYAGMVHIGAGSERPPQMILLNGDKADPSNTMLYQQLARSLYGGCRVNVAIKPWLQENKHGRGIRCDLVAIQFAKDDQPFGDAAPDITGVFGQVAVHQAPQAPAVQMPGVPTFGTAPGIPSFLGK